MTRIVVKIIGVLVLIAAFVGVRYYLTGDSFGLFETPFDVEIAREVKAQNIQLPMMIDSFTRLDSVTAGPGKAISYGYTITDDAAADGIRGDPDTVRSKLKEGVCSGMPVYRKNGATVNYSYKDSSGTALISISVDTREC